jgi:hypothetical protein
MRMTKFGIVLIGLLMLTRYVPSYYNSWQFNQFIQKESERARAVTHLRDTLLDKAKSYSLPVDTSNIVITKDGSIYRVAVDYSVPVDLVVYSPELKFHVVAAGLMRR